MPTDSRFLRVSRIMFLVSSLVLAFLYGFGAAKNGWPPGELVSRAIAQARALEMHREPGFLAPSVHQQGGARTLLSGSVRPGLTLIASFWREQRDGGEWSAGLRLIDRAGRTVHRWPLAPGEIFPDSAYLRNTPIRHADAHGMFLFPDGDVLVNLNYLGTVRLDACGSVEWTMAAGNHHSISQAQDGTFWIPGMSRNRDATIPSSSTGERTLPRAVYRDLLLNVSPDGELLRAINVLDVLYANDLEHYLVKHDAFHDEDPVHLNDIEPLGRELADDFRTFRANDLLISLHDLDLVLVMDPETGRVKWHESRFFIWQHDPDFVPGGRIGVFDNNADGTARGTILGGSRVVALEPHTDSLSVLYAPSTSEPFYTEILGSWQRLAGGNMLLVEGTAGRVVEVTTDGRIAWEWVHPATEQGRVPGVGGALRTQITPEVVASWPCTSLN